MNEHPLVVGFLCTWCSYEGADLAGRSRIEIPSSFRTLCLPCTGRVSASYILEAFKGGAQAVAIFGCRHEDCHYISGSRQAENRATLLRSLLPQFGIEPERVVFDHVSAKDAEKFAAKAAEIVERVSRFDRLELKGSGVALRG